MNAAVNAQAVDARVVSVKGAALFNRNQRSFTLGKNDSLMPGDEIDTRGGGRVVIELTDGSLVIVQPYSHIIIADYRSATSLRELFQIVLGRVRVKINHFGGKPNPYRVNSPTASILVRGTEFGVNVDPSGDTRVVVYEGLVEVESLGNPRHRALVSPGKGVLIRSNADIRFFTPGSGGEIGERSNGGNSSNRLIAQDDDSRNEDSEQGENVNSTISLANNYKRYIDSLVEPGQLPPLLRFTAFSDSHLDSLDNPAYLTEFTSMEGRFWLMPSLSRTRDISSEHSISPAFAGPPVDLGLLGQGTFFVPLQNARMVIGGALAGSGSRLQAVTEDLVSELPESLFQGETSGIRRSSGVTETSTRTVSLMAARQIGGTGRTTVGVGVDYVSGKGLLRGQISLENGAAMKVIERLEAVSNIGRTRLQLGLTHEFGRGHKLGLIYRRGSASADDSDRTRQTNGLQAALDSVRYRGWSSEFGLRLRGPVTRRLFYGIEGSWLVVGLNERIHRAVIVDSTEREHISRTAVSLGLGYALRRRTILSADLGFGQSRVSELHYEDATANLIQDERQKIPFISTQLGVQTDVWRELFASASIFTIRQSCATDLKLYPDRFGRRLTSYGTFEPDGITRRAVTNLLSDFGIGWRFTPNLLTQYVASFNFDLGPPRHIILLRYSFQREK